MFLVSGADLIVLFIALELMALCEYILTGFLRRSRRSNEAAVKFFLLGAFSSGLLLYGMSLLYGIGGSTKLSIIAERLRDRPAGDPLSWVALITLLAGIYFKIAAVPFHQWTRTLTKARQRRLPPLSPWRPRLPPSPSLSGSCSRVCGPTSGVAGFNHRVAIATMTLGNLAAITQTNIKRFFGYSTISHVGYLLLGW